MTTRQFEIDNAWSLQLRNMVLIPTFSRQVWPEGHYVLMDKGRLTTLVQKQLAVHMVVQCRNGVTVGIEEKSAAGRAMNICTFALEENSSNVISSIF